jgi:hypothetical protein
MKSFLAIPACLQIINSVDPFNRLMFWQGQWRSAPIRIRPAHGNMVALPNDE